MNLQRKIGLGILAFAVVAAGVLMFSGKNQGVAEKNNNGAGEKLAKADAFNLTKDGGQLTVGTDLLANPDDANFTDKLATELNAKLIALNPENDLSSGNINVPDENIFSQDILDQFKADLFNSSENVKAEDLNLVLDKIPQTTWEYLRSFLSIIQKNKITDDLVMSALASFADAQDPAFLNPVINSLDEAISEFKAMPVPVSWAYIHVSLINLTVAKKSLLLAMTKFQDDPLKAMVAAEMINEIDGQTTTWNNYVAQKLKDDNVSFNFSQ